MNGTCIRCGRPTDADIDEYSILHEHCMEAANKEASDRNDAIAGGSISVPNMTAKEREKVLAARREHRDAIVKE